MASRGTHRATRFQLDWFHIATQGRRLAPEKGQLRHYPVCLHCFSRARRLAPRKGQLGLLPLSVTPPLLADGLAALLHQDRDFRPHQVHGGRPVDDVHRVRPSGRRILHQGLDQAVLLVVVGVPPSPFLAGFLVALRLAGRVPADPLPSSTAGFRKEPSAAMPAVLQFGHPLPPGDNQGCQLQTTCRAAPNKPSGIVPGRGTGPCHRALSVGATAPGWW